MLATGLSSAMLFLLLPFKDQAVSENREIQTQSTSQQIRSIFKVLKEKKVIPLISLVCFMTMTPSYDALMTIYFIKKLGFSQVDLANLTTIGTLFYMLALILYQVYLKRFSGRMIFLLTNYMQCALSFVFMMVVYESTRGLVGD